MKVGVVVGRFQIDNLHSGHRDLLKQAAKASEKLVIFVGSVNKAPSHNNPLDFKTREMVIKKCLAELYRETYRLYSSYKNYCILPLPDRGNNRQWVEILDSLLYGMFPTDEVVLWVGRASGLDTVYVAEGGKFTVKKVHSETNSSATSRREHIGGERRLIDPYSAIWITQQQFPKVYPTVDIALFDEGGFLNLGRKKGEKLWRFPGGFVDPSDKSYLAAAKRELREECGDIEAGDWKFLGSTQIDDFRYRNERDKIITSFYYARRLFGRIVAGDDLHETCGFTFPGITPDQVVEEHRILLEMLEAHYNAGSLPKFPKLERIEA